MAQVYKYILKYGRTGTAHSINYSAHQTNLYQINII